MNDRELWMKKLKEKLDDYSEPVPASSWDQLEKELLPSVGKRIYPYRRWAMAAAAVLLVGVSSISLYFLNTSTADDIRHTSTPTLTFAPDVMPVPQEPDVQVPKVEPPMTSDNKRHMLAKAESLPTTKDVTKEGAVENAALIKPVEVVNPEEENKEKQTAKEPMQEKKRVHKPSGKDKLHVPDKSASARKGAWSMGLSVGNTGGTTTSEVGGLQGNMSRVNLVSNSTANGVIQIPGDQTVVFKDGIPYLRQTKEVSDIQHHQPISFGLSVRKSLPKGFSVETGLTYTLLSSDAKISGSDKKVEQKLHYIGIPVRANWDFLDKRLFTLYVSGGGMFEKCVYGELGGEKETVKPLQFSVNGAVGAQFNATKRIGIYVEPGVAYFFDDGSEMKTIRKENPFNFNVQAGVRFTY